MCLLQLLLVMMIISDAVDVVAVVAAYVLKNVKVEHTENHIFLVVAVHRDHRVIRSKSLPLVVSQVVSLTVSQIQPLLQYLDRHDLYQSDNSNQLGKRHMCQTRSISGLDLHP